MAVVAKFQVTEVTNRVGGGVVKLSAAVPSQDDDKITRDEETRFWEATPNGEVTLHINNVSALEQFQAGDKMYLTFERETEE